MTNERHHRVVVAQDKKQHKQQQCKVHGKVGNAAQHSRGDPGKFLAHHTGSSDRLGFNRRRVQHLRGQQFAQSLLQVQHPGVRQRFVDIFLCGPIAHDHRIVDALLQNRH